MGLYVAWPGLAILSSWSQYLRCTSPVYVTFPETAVAKGRPRTCLAFRVASLGQPTRQSYVTALWVLLYPWFKLHQVGLVLRVFHPAHVNVGAHGGEFFEQSRGLPRYIL